MTEPSTDTSAPTRTQAQNGAISEALQSLASDVSHIGVPGVDSAEHAEAVCNWLLAQAKAYAADSVTAAEAQRGTRPWHKLHADEYEDAVAAAAGALMGLKIARNEDRPALGGIPAGDFREAVAVAFDEGFQCSQATAGGPS